MNKQIITTGLRSEELEGHIERQLSSIRTKGLHDIGTVVQQPALAPDVVLDETEAALEELKAHVRQWFQPQGRKLEAALEKFKVDRLKEDTQKALESLHRKLQHFEIDLARIKVSYPFHRLWIPLGAIACTVGIDALVNYRSIQVLVPNVLTAAIVALFTVAGLGLAAHAIGGKMQEAKTANKKRLWALIGLAGGAVVFFVLGILREQFYGTGDSWMGSPVLWTVWNLFFFAIAIFISYRYLPTKAQWKERSEQLNLERQKKETEQAIATTKGKLEQVEQEQASTLQQIAQLKAYEEDTLLRLDKQRDLLRSTLIKEYTLKSGQPYVPVAHIIEAPKNEQL